MSFTDLTFIFLLLPLFLAIYYISKEGLREYVLCACSLFFYAFGSIGCVLLLIFSICVDVCIGWLIDKCRERPALRRGLLLLGVIYNLSILGYYKYADFILDNVSALLGGMAEPKNLALPLGISFFTFKSISYLADIYLGKIKAPKNPMHAALYLSFFAQAQSGPLSRYQDMACGAGMGGHSRFAGFSEGACRFMAGMQKKMLLANVLSNITAEAFSAPSGQMSAAYAWLGAVCYSLELYFDFSGYSDMAIGVSRMFGYSCPENFDYPYMADSVSGFWRRWHITLGAWFRDYVYIPLGGSRARGGYCVYTGTFWPFGH